MGLRAGGFYAKVWEIKMYPSGKAAKVRISTSKKNKQTDQYEDDFGGYAMFAGQAFAKLNTISEKSRIKVTDFEVTNKYDKEKNTTAFNVTVWDFEPADGAAKPATAQAAAAPTYTAADELPF